MDFEGAIAGKKDYRSVSRDVDNILQDFKKQNVDAVVVDLRSNGGGSLIEAIQLAGLFIKDGPVVQIRDRIGRLGIRRDMDNGYIAYDGPLVVLNSRMSASASEIFSGAMQDYRRAVIVGDSSSFGKGTVLEVVRLNDLFSLIPINFNAGSLQYESSVFYRVNGSSVQQLGVNADIVIPSLTEVMEIGERFSRNHLPYDEIDPLSYKRYYPGFESMTAELAKRSKERIAKDKFFEIILKEQGIYEKYRKENRRSLNEKERYKEYFAEKKLQDESRKSPEEKKSKKEDKDGVLKEAVNIAADFAELQKR
ncbi:MAG: carboxy terminal-processing peptidase [Lentisphaeria bacterium]|nr:carboxy terminal-processing peptidase [Lentisphaeria bacterium]